MLTEFEFNKIIEALWHAERNAHPNNKETWRDVADRARHELREFVASNSASCQCEDRPCCSCDADVYQPTEYTDIGDLADRQREQAFAERDYYPCRICGEDLENNDNEDDVVQGFHAECAENQE
jgi:hypothetical protein